MSTKRKSSSQSESPITYASTGVNYDAMDPLKRLAQLRARATADNLNRFGMREIEPSRGESAYVWEEDDGYRAFVIEGLGTKNRVADETRKITGKTHYDAIAQDTVAMIVNDLIVVGADPQVVNAYFAVGSSDWFVDEERSRDLVEGWAKACNLAGAVWGGGETPTLKGIIEPDTIDLSGSAVGIIKPKERLTLGDKLTPGDAVLLVESSGIHANGLTLARTIASRLPEGYATILSDGKTYGESLLTPTYIYASLIRDLFNSGIDIHYMVNITGHGWRKLMRASRDLSYVIDRIPKPQPVFNLIQEQSRNSDEEMYGNFNMGAGFAVFVPEQSATLAQQIAISKHNLSIEKAGYVDQGPKQVVIKPKNITFKGESLNVR
jgi:phosphoribosylformylglycinamidine cyclo-ligase